MEQKHVVIGLVIEGFVFLPVTTGNTVKLWEEKDKILLACRK
jgi:hypothetical protein